MSIAVPLSLAAALAIALAACVLALHRAGVRATAAEARSAALVARARASQTALRDLRSAPILDAPASRPVPPDTRRGPRRAPRRPVSDLLPPARP